ncbi:hypothetical protein PIB30_041952 [Stylosanthes scabra]|uniref:Uncharacterized protein n=1 Tax=Stylosanthes scabra TaxID=79078 RepID=A0ABU6TFB2_9FABA|nr:hypothetical protein [Stylosanthes scabra]
MHHGEHHTATVEEAATIEHIPPPGYLPQTRHPAGFETVHHFVVACAPGPGLDVVNGVDRFSPDIYLAREDDVASLTKPILSNGRMGGINLVPNVLCIHNNVEPRSQQSSSKSRVTRKNSPMVYFAPN